MRITTIFFVTIFLASALHAQDAYVTAIAEGSLMDPSTWTVDDEVATSLPGPDDSCFIMHVYYGIGGRLTCGVVQITFENGGYLDLVEGDTLEVYGHYFFDAEKPDQTKEGTVMFVGESNTTITVDGYTPSFNKVIINKKHPIHPVRVLLDNGAGEKFGENALMTNQLHVQRGILDLFGVNILAQELYVDANEDPTESGHIINDYLFGFILANYQVAADDTLSSLLGKIIAHESGELMAGYNARPIITTDSTAGEIEFEHGMWGFGSEVSFTWLYKPNPKESLQAYKVIVDFNNEEADWDLEKLEQYIDEQGYLNVDLTPGEYYLQFATVTPSTAREDEILPHTFALSLAYPNPFNPTTQLELQIERVDYITVRAYDVLGRQVAVLRQDVLPAGSHKIVFDAADLASGMYVIMAQSGTHRQIRTVMLTK